MNKNKPLILFWNRNTYRDEKKSLTRGVKSYWFEYIMALKSLCVRKSLQKCLPESVYLNKKRNLAAISPYILIPENSQSNKTYYKYILFLVMLCKQIRLIIHLWIFSLMPLKAQQMTIKVNNWWTHLFLSSLHSTNTL